MLGRDGSRFYVNSATGMGRTTLKQKEIGKSMCQDGSIPWSMVPSGYVIGEIGIRREIEAILQITERHARRIMRENGNFPIEQWRGMPATNVLSLAAFAKEHKVNRKKTWTKNLYGDRKS